MLSQALKPIVTRVIIVFAREIARDERRAAPRPPSRLLVFMHTYSAPAP